MLGRLLDFLYPRTCELCGRPVDRPSRYLCSDCLMRLPVLPTVGCCRRCGRDVPALDREFVCDDCRRHHPHFDRAGSALRFEEDARQLLLDFKFNRHVWLRKDFADLIEGMVRARFKVAEIGLVLPMPTTLWHRTDRGYNPSDILAADLAGRLGCPCSRRALARTGQFERQGGLDEESRRQNVIDTIALTGHGRRLLARLPADRAVLVVDDVMTTGSTLSECSRILKAAGRSSVWCASLCRSVRS